MKIHIIIVISLFLSAVSVFGQETKKVKLDDGHQQEKIDFGICNVFITKVENNDDDHAKVLIEVENLDEENLIVLFNKSYPEKVLKNQSIRFDKFYPGTKGKRAVDAFEGLRDVVRIEPGTDRKKLLLQSIVEGEMFSCDLPFYIAKYKSKKILGAGTFRSNKLLLCDMRPLKLEIEVEMKPDENYIRLCKENEKLMNDLKTTGLCTNPRHRPALAKQKEDYTNRIEKIISEIDGIIARNNWDVSSRSYQRYKAIKDQLAAINLSEYERDCGKRHSSVPVPSHRCRYCNYSFQQIYHKLDDYYKIIYNSNNRKAAKANVISEVNLLYKCCTDARCTNHASWSTNEYKARITERYHRINNF